MSVKSIAASPPGDLEQAKKTAEDLSLGLQYTIAQRERLKTILRIMADMLNDGISLDYAKVMRTLLDSPAERHQDVFALLANKGKANGFFVEFGACDGLAVSNTVMLERAFGWRGILAEPDAFWKDRLKGNRSAIIDTRCVSSETGKQIAFFQSDRPGNSSPDQGHVYIGQVESSYLVETISLADLLDYHSAPRMIDFISIDVEGHEKPVLERFDFDRYKFGFICVEEYEHVATEDSVQPILEAAGYVQVLPQIAGRPFTMQITGVDKFFVPEGHFAERWVAGDY